VYYQEQQRFLSRSRIFGAVAVCLVLACSAMQLVFSQARQMPDTLKCGAIAAALAIFIYYTPNYLYLTTAATKRQRWQIKIRWRCIGAAFVLGLLPVPSTATLGMLLAAVAWLSIANRLAAKLKPRDCYLYFWLTDFSLPAWMLLSGRMAPLLGAVLLSASAYFSIVMSEQAAFLWAGVVTTFNSLLLIALWQLGRLGTESFVAAIALQVVTALATAFLVYRAQRRNARNVQTAMRELEQFTGFSPEEIRRLWLVSDRELAQSWQAAALDESDAERLREWYRENSRLYMFAISAYNLEYKRIRSNMKMLRLGRGSCLDYGAGNGELVLELARRGHRVAYYDVEGESMKFARFRARQQNLEVHFFSAKEALTAFAREGGFDTIFSFDVLEHLPDLPGELKFLSSLLNRNGLFAFDVPAGSTKSHPMHLNHSLSVRTHMQALGLQEHKLLTQKLAFRKEEKYFFRLA
jgi:2-polyprenyl-3-methyl-5-hydroxy-6-metoxy-1,4-benzoquinol methylase